MASGHIRDDPEALQDIYTQMGLKGGAAHLDVAPSTFSRWLNQHCIPRDKRQAGHASSALRKKLEAETGMHSRYVSVYQSYLKRGGQKIDERRLTSPQREFLAYLAFLDDECHSSCPGNETCLDSADDPCYWYKEGVATKHEEILARLKADQS